MAHLFAARSSGASIVVLSASRQGRLRLLDPLADGLDSIEPQVHVPHCRREVLHLGELALHGADLPVLFGDPRERLCQLQLHRREPALSSHVGHRDNLRGRRPIPPRPSQHHAPDQVAAVVVDPHPEPPRTGDEPPPEVGDSGA